MPRTLHWLPLVLGMNSQLFTSASAHLLGRWSWVFLLCSLTVLGQDRHLPVPRFLLLSLCPECSLQGCWFLPFRSQLKYLLGGRFCDHDIWPTPPPPPLMSNLQYTGLSLCCRTRLNQGVLSDSLLDCELLEGRDGFPPRSRVTGT